MTDIEQSKDRLRNAFARLEDVVDRRIKAVESRAREQITAAQQSGDLSIVRQELDSLNQQLAHEREEHGSTQNKLGEQQEIIQHLKQKQQLAIQKVDNVMAQLEKAMKQSEAQE